MLIGDSDQRKLRWLLIEYEQEMKQLKDDNELLKKENDWLKMVLGELRELRRLLEGYGRRSVLR